MKQALICASFGTTVANGRKDLEAVEQALQAVAPDRPFCRAWTSRIIRKRMAARGESVDGLPEALEKLAAAGYDRVAVQPTHLLYGYEYDKIKSEIAPYQSRFAHLALGKPLLADTHDLQTVARLLGEAYPAQPGEVLVLMGHGTEHFAGVVYPALQSAFALQGRDDVFVAAVEGWPALAEVLPQILASGCRKAHLVPLLLVAGDHACHDMAGEQAESWKSQ
ncbi:sirohydrochlorin cobaltochelatase, partial [uncultured Subdoligranulum sp.]|uniref:sirohydrochlorin cobaltochelatase n=1 Tax=uncultured Subdoligranulum sp. TaxID=512298 RepID=UPI0025E5BE76